MGCPLKDKKRAFSIQGKPVADGVGAGGRAFLSVAPALPVLHAGGAPAAAGHGPQAGPRAPRLARRSHSSVGASGQPLGTVSCNAGVVGVLRPGETADDGELQSMHDGRLQVARTVKEKEKNPDRISLDRRGLNAVPLMPGESRVRLLSLQHNIITRMDSLSAAGLTLSRLVFLDIYDNQVDRISGLDCLDNLRVLLMGKNRIKKIEGLRRQTRLEVLDLHGNQITSVQGLSFLCELKVLNLAGNQIRSVGATDLQGLRNLQELNLRRNRLRKLLGFGDTPHLVKLFLSNNELSSVEDMYSVAKAAHLREVTIDGNPVAQGGDCVSFLVSYLPNLMMLSNLQITDPVRKAAMSWRSNKEAASSLFLQLGAGEPEGVVKREEVIFNARTNWELLRTQSCCGPGPGPGYVNGVGPRPGTATGTPAIDGEPFQDGEADDRGAHQGLQRRVLPAAADPRSAPGLSGGEAGRRGDR
ncbi:hypothetical protein FOCC_FOCC002714 [Frankliniella occidentalis]|nr:hypothetical protein FOCC_FOCC002714 [Frankliniella occidentalis]